MRQYSEPSWIIQEVKISGREENSFRMWFSGLDPGSWILNLFGADKSERNRSKILGRGENSFGEFMSHWRTRNCGGRGKSGESKWAQDLEGQNDVPSLFIREMNSWGIRIKHLEPPVEIKLLPGNGSNRTSFTFWFYFYSHVCIDLYWTWQNLHKTNKPKK